MSRKLSFVFALILSSMILLQGVSAQQTQGRWALGVAGGVNYWINDLNQHKIGPGGTLFLRYGLAPAFSLGLSGGMEGLKSAQSPGIPDLPYSYLRLDAYPVALTGWFHLSPGSSFNPYLRIGGGVMPYHRKTVANAPAPDDKMRATVIIPVGIGFEAFMSRNVAFTLDAGVTSTGNAIDLRDNTSPDGFASGRAGIVWYPGSSDGDDPDGDGLTNGQERRLGTYPENPDSDGDGLNDGEEVKRYRTNPLRVDSDSDGLSDYDEVTKYKTDPIRFDSDGDGLSDGDEILKYSTDPTRVDTDGDGLSDGDEILKLKTDPLKVDSDSDGLSDWDEVKSYHTDPANPDTDGDGIIDGEEVTKYKTNPLKVDTDGGGLIDGAEIIRGTDPLNPKDDVMKETIILERGKSVVMDGINFTTGSATLTRESEDILERAFTALAANPDVKVEIAGYTDNVGGKAANEKLSQRRADAVRAWFVAKGIAANRLSARGFGMKDPIETNATPEGRGKNRRIEFHVR
jgi:outer membrane protein OmpA-like peptidoglycan-associated protein